MNNNVLYHYGVPGMRWGVRRANVTGVSTPKHKKRHNTNDNPHKSNTPKNKLSKSKKIAIGSAITITALAGVGTMLAKDAIEKRVNTLLVGKAIAKALM